MKSRLNIWVGFLAALLFGVLLAAPACSSSGQSEPDQERPAAPPVLHAQSRSFTLDSREQEFVVNYTVENPVAGGEVSWRCNAEWVRQVGSEPSALRFSLEANSGKERTTTLRLIYPGATILPIQITQISPGEQLAPEIQLSKLRYTLSAQEEDLTIDYTILNPIEGGAIEAHTTADWLHIYATDRESISLLVDANAGAERTATVTLSYPEARPVELHFTQQGEGQQESVEPSFTNLAATEITASTVTLGCHLAYEGGASISEAGFCYCGPSGQEQEVKVVATTGTKRVQLSGLEPESRYEWYFYAVVGGELYTSASQHFETLAEVVTPTPGNLYRTGWPELCTEEENSDYYYAHHITDLKMKGNKARNYTVCFSAKHHCPVWVAAPRHDAYEGSTDRTNAYNKDPQIPSNIQYNNKDTGGGCNKGHMLGSAERTASTLTNKQVFYYTNIAPQYSSGFNTGGGGWNKLEDWVDKQVCSDTTYLVIGTYFERFTDGYGETASPKKISFGGRSDVSCPTMFYIAILRTKSGNSGKSVINAQRSELKCAAFVRTHTNNHKGQEVTSRDMMSIAELEELTGHQFFVNVPNAPKESYSASEWGL